MGRRLTTRLRTLLGHPRAPLVAIALGVALVLPSLGAGLGGDDYIHALRLAGDPVVAGLSDDPFDPFVFASGEPEQRRLWMEQGAFAWWTAPDLRLAFWRPLSSLTHVVDHRVLVFVGVGAMGLVARFLTARWEEGAPAAGRAMRVAARVVTVILVFAHLVAGPLLLPFRSLTMRTLEATFVRVARLVPRDPAIAERRWDENALVPFAPPPIGASVTFPAADVLAAYLGR